MTDIASAARLMIHVDDAHAEGDARVGTLLQRMRSRYRARANAVSHAPVGVEIHDLRGQRVFASNDAGLRVDVALPPGTYHVSTFIGDAQRRYTVALAQGASFDLHLRPLSDGHL